MGELAQNPPRNGEGDRVKRGGGGPRILKSPIKQVKRARKLRREMSLPEVLLWDALRRRSLGLRFRRQYPSDRMTVDFACLSRRLIIEVDGEQHGRGDQPRRDEARDAIMTREGFTVMRIAARDVLKNLDGVVRSIVSHCSEVGPLHHAPHGPPPRAGEDLA
jgi:very-short-patch-repair endonuclease